MGSKDEDLREFEIRTGFYNFDRIIEVMGQPDRSLAKQGSDSPVHPRKTWTIKNHQLLYVCGCAFILYGSGATRYKMTRNCGINHFSAHDERREG